MRTRDKFAGEVKCPRTVEALVAQFKSLHESRRSQKRRLRRRSQRRRTIRRPAVRNEVLCKTGKRCHICGGLIAGRWQADHVLAHSGGGGDSPENYLPAHRLCNNYRWDYLAEEFQWILKIGVWARTLMEESSPKGGIGKEMAERFFKVECYRENRRVVRVSE
jgi:5-methylcytosine-specific restriction endonuclease McrA